MDSPKPRLASLDFFRGLALVFVLVDHIDIYASDANVFLSWTPYAWGYCDISEIFFYISGFTFGYIYSTRLKKLGLLPNFIKVSRRTIQIYLWYVCTVATVLLLGLVTQSTVLLKCLSYPVWANWYNLGAATLLLQYQPFCLHILALYCVIFLPMLLVLWVMNFCRWLILILSVGLYAITHYSPQLNLPVLDSDRGWYFNPFAWQFLFILAMACGASYASGQRITRSIWTLGFSLSVLILGVSAWDKVFYEPSLVNSLREMAGLEYPSSSSWLISKNRTGVLRIIHVLALAVVASSLAIWTKRPMFIKLEFVSMSIIVAGKHSLFAYCLGVLLTYAALLTLAVLGDTLIVTLFIGIDCVIVLLASCHMLHSNIRISAE